jgi:hypothetical protein
VYPARSHCSLGSSSATQSRRRGAAQPIIAAGRSKRFTLGLLAGIGAALPVATVLGGGLLAEASVVDSGYLLC